MCCKNCLYRLCVDEVANSAAENSRLKLKLDMMVHGSLTLLLIRIRL